MKIKLCKKNLFSLLIIFYIGINSLLLLKIHNNYISVNNDLKNIRKQNASLIDGVKENNDTINKLNKIIEEKSN